MPEYVNCNLCGMDGTKLIDIAEGPFKVVRCKNCGLIYVNPQPDTHDIVDSYSKDYYIEWITKQQKERIKLWNKRLWDLKRYKDGGKLLDVGCGDGAFLSLARKDGWDIYGTEISEDACRYAEQIWKLNIFKGELKEAGFGDGFFDCITVWHTLEHLTDPLGTLKEINRILRGDGVLIVETPNVNDYIFKIVYRLAKGKPERLFSTRAKELHLFHFSPTTLKMMVEKAGFRVLKITVKISQIFWPKKLIEYAGIIIFWLTRLNIGNTIRLYARKV